MIFEKFFKRFFKKALTGAEQDRFFTTNNRQSSNFNSSRDFINAYQLVNYVGNAVSIVSGDIASLDWEIVDQNNKKFENQDILSLFRAPMPGMTWNNWIYRATQHLLLDGNVFWIIEQKNALAKIKNKPSELKILNPSLVYVHDDQGEEIRANTPKISNAVGFYRVEYNSSIIQVAAENIIHSMLPSPHNCLRGIGKIQSNIGIMDSERLTTIFHNAFFKQGAKMDYAITPDPEIGAQEFKLYKDQLRQEYEGERNLSKMFIAPPGSKIQTLNLSQKDMQLIEQRKITRQDIYSFFNIPPIISGNLDLAKYDSAGEQSKIYYDVDLPRTYKILEASLTKIVNLFDDRLSFRFIPKNIVDRSLTNQISKDMFDRGAITANEYRERLGMTQDTSVESLNSYWISSNLLPSTYASTNTKSRLAQGTNEEEKGLSISDLDGWEKKATKKQLSLHIQARNKKQKIEKQFIKMVNDYYKSLEKRVLSNVKNFEITGTKVPNIDDVFNFDDEVRAAKKMANSVFTSGVILAIQFNNEKLGSTVDETFQNIEIRLVVEKLNTRYADSTIDTRRDEVRSILQKGLDEGLSISNIKSELQVYFDTLTGDQAWRAQRIARTEASFIWDQGSYLSYKQLGVTTVDMVGCTDTHEPYDCNKRGLPLSAMLDANVHANHIGTFVPSRL